MAMGKQARRSKARMRCGGVARWCRIQGSFLHRSCVRFTCLRPPPSAPHTYTDTRHISKVPRVNPTPFLAFVWQRVQARQARSASITDDDDDDTRKKQTHQLIPPPTSTQTTTGPTPLLLQPQPWPQLEETSPAWCSSSSSPWPMPLSGNPPSPPPASSSSSSSARRAPRSNTSGRACDHSWPRAGPRWDASKPSVS